MLVKSIHFIPSVPGAPVYELMDGQILLPFMNKKTGSFFYYSEKEMTKNITDKKQLAQYKMIYDAARKQINSVRDSIMNPVVN